MGCYNVPFELSRGVWGGAGKESVKCMWNLFEKVLGRVGKMLGKPVAKPWEAGKTCIVGCWGGCYKIATRCLYNCDIILRRFWGQIYDYLTGFLGGGLAECCEVWGAGQWYAEELGGWAIIWWKMVKIWWYLLVKKLSVCIFKIFYLAFWPLDPFFTIFL